MKAINKMKKNKAVLSRYTQIQIEIQTIKNSEEKSDRKSRKTLLSNSAY